VDGEPGLILHDVSEDAVSTHRRLVMRYFIDKRYAQNKAAESAFPFHALASSSKLGTSPAVTLNSFSKVCSIFQMLCMTAFFSPCYFERVTSMRNAWEPPQQDDTTRSGSSSTATCQDFVTPRLGCLHSWHYLMYGFCCFNLRVADTAHAVGVWNYWQVLLGLLGIDFCMVFFSDMESGVYLWVLRTCFCAYTRMLLGKAIGRNGSLSCIDFCFWCLCPCLAAVQEAREIDMVTESRVDCGYGRGIALVTADSARTPLVGDAVEAGSLQLAGSLSLTGVRSGSLSDGTQSGPLVVPMPEEFLAHVEKDPEVGEQLRAHPDDAMPVKDHRISTTDGEKDVDEAEVLHQASTGGGIPVKSSDVSQGEMSWVSSQRSTEQSQESQAMLHSTET